MTSSRMFAHVFVLGLTVVVSLLSLVRQEPERVLVCDTHPEKASSDKTWSYKGIDVMFSGKMFVGRNSSTISRPATCCGWYTKAATTRDEDLQDRDQLSKKERRKSFKWWEMQRF